MKTKEYWTSLIADILRCLGIALIVGIFAGMSFLEKLFDAIV